jgi:hypothetical protein
MHKAAIRMRRLILSIMFCCGIVLLAILSANVFPDQTWKVLSRIEKGYADIISRTTPVPTGANRITEEAAIDEAVFRYFLQWKVKEAEPAFLSVEGRDPSDELMARFAPLGKTVSKASAAYIRPEFEGIPLHRSTGERGVLLEADSIKWVFGDRVEVRATLTCGLLCGEGCIYQLVKTKGRWTVETCKQHFVSKRKITIPPAIAGSLVSPPASTWTGSEHER